MDAAGYHGSFLSLLNPFGLLTGALFILLFLVHGALFLTVKTEGELSARALAAANRFWPALLIVAAVFLVAAYPATKLYDNYLSVPMLLAIPLLAVTTLLTIRISTAKGKLLTAFAASCLTILLVVATGIIGLFPNLIPSSIDPVSSLTIYNSSSSLYTLKIMTAVALLFVPIVIAYKIWVYRVFRAKVGVQDVLEDEHSY
jgi:cytochrome d ubiquinol oxidase subunit II